MPDTSRRIRSIQMGDTKILNHGHHHRFGDPYHFVLTLTWPRFYLGLVVVFVVVNLLFGAVYWMLPGSVANVPDGAFASYVFFSIETLATVGYGVMAPASTAGHLVASVEILVGMVGVALTTGLVFARFAKPTAKFIFSSRAMIRMFGGQRVFMLRVANERYNRIMGANAKVSLVRHEVNREGEAFYRITDLPLVRESTQVFSLTWTLMHIIDEQSPLVGVTEESLLRTPLRILVSVTGHDEVMAAEVRAVHEYQAADIVFDGRFADVIHVGPDDERVVDLTKFHDIEK